MRAIGGRRRCSAREHCTGAPIPNAARQAVLSNRTQISPPSDSDGGEIESGFAPGAEQGNRLDRPIDRPPIALLFTRQSPRSPSDRPTIYKAIAPIALQSPPVWRRAIVILIAGSPRSPNYIPFGL